jgi:signal transduction histidine kinase
VAQKQKTLKEVFTPKRQLRISNEQLRKEMYRRNLELAEINQTLSLLRTIDTLVLESHDTLDALCRQITQAISENSAFPFAALLSAPDSVDSFKLLGISSSSHRITPDWGKLLLEHHTSWFKSSERQINLSLSQINDVTNAHHPRISKDLVTELQQDFHLKSVIITKLISRQKLVGLMVIGLGQDEGKVTEKEQALLDRLGKAVGIAIDNKLLFEENQRVLAQLKRSNAKLRQLDKTKDDFISMASHQLRTPLTSVKGYLSMTLEGDGGKVNDKQRKLLSQAFISSQRMVYLIADMLNVSRLKTGKFVIEPEATDLADTVATELDQLMGTAAARGLKLTYNRPHDFPVLMLDQTKIRQVVMNFVDNAIYYTPSGGRIDVTLQDTGKAIEFIVTDNGIGVPRSEQHHLFNKFYRANNAKKARPDGTGLGLFMAKKVIIAQGGSIIFHSQEGKGSTFGFSIAKNKVQPNSQSKLGKSESAPRLSHKNQNDTDNVETTT